MEQQTQKPSKPFFSNRIFWDVDPEKMDYNNKASFIIEWVFERGDVEDIRMCRRFYGDEKVGEVLLNAKWLSLATIYLAMALFNNKPEDYKCYKQAQLNPAHFQY
ncbi:MAG: hypothetical protein ABIP30_01355 [Ferruginibacter sp.]